MASYSRTRWRCWILRRWFTWCGWKIRLALSSRLSTSLAPASLKMVLVATTTEVGSTMIGEPVLRQGNTQNAFLQFPWPTCLRLGATKSPVEGRCSPGPLVHDVVVGPCPIFGSALEGGEKTGARIEIMEKLVGTTAWWPVDGARWRDGEFRSVLCLDHAARQRLASGSSI
jgi:hypothetical protein